MRSTLKKWPKNNAKWEVMSQNIRRDGLINLGELTSILLHYHINMLVLSLNL